MKTLKKEKRKKENLAISRRLQNQTKKPKMKEKKKKRKEKNGRGEIEKVRGELSTPTLRLREWSYRIPKPEKTTPTPPREMLRPILLPSRVA